MTGEEIFKYNKRCAEFLGMYDYSIDNKYFEKGQYYCYPEKEKNPGSGYYTIIQKTSDGYYGIFNSDWNWIHEILDAIARLEKDYPIASDELLSLLIKSNKEAVVQAINQFLIWHNKVKI